MSTIPGYTLEAYLMWLLDLIVDGDGSANLSLSIAEAVGVKSRRLKITKEEFKTIVSMYEQCRDQVERALDNYEEDDMSWRDYAGFVMSDIVNEEISRSFITAIKNR